MRCVASRPGRERLELLDEHIDEVVEPDDLVLERRLQLRVDGPQLRQRVRGGRHRGELGAGRERGVGLGLALVHRQQASMDARECLGVARLRQRVQRERIDRRGHPRQQRLDVLVQRARHGRAARDRVGAGVGERGAEHALGEDVDRGIPQLA
ncbi:MAG: hypothetical protein U0168_20205 [Nannocystaceae bacterium]